MVLGLSAIYLAGSHFLLCPNLIFACDIFPSVNDADPVYYPSILAQNMSHGASLLSHRDHNESFFDAIIQKAVKCRIKLMTYQSASSWHDECFYYGRHGFPTDENDSFQ